MPVLQEQDCTAYTPFDANDGVDSTSWSPLEDDTSPWWRVDLGLPYTVTEVLITWDTAKGVAPSYTVDVSTDNQTYTTIASESGNATIDSLDIRARYLRISVTSGSPVYLQEAQVFGVLTLPPDQENPCKCPNPQGPGFGGPFNARTGFLWTQATDLSLLGVGPTLDWQRTYVSRATSEISGALGVGWQHPFATRLITEPLSADEAGLMTVIAPDGNHWRFQDLDVDDGSFYIGLPGTGGNLYRFDDIYVLTRDDQTAYWYDATTGRLHSFWDAQMRRLNMIYDGDRLVRVEDDADPQRYLMLTYDPTGTHIISVSDVLSRTVQYEYDSLGDLTQAYDAMGRPTSYFYQNHLLTGIDDALGQPIERTSYDQYTAAGRVISQTLQDGRQLLVDYQSDQTIITTNTPDGQQEVQEISYEPGNTMTGMTLNGITLKEADFEHNFAPGAVTDGNGNTTNVIFNEAGKPLTVTNALNQPTQYVYDSYNYLYSVTNPLSVRTEYERDYYHNLIRRTTGITTAFPLGFTTVYTYNIRYPMKHWLEEELSPDGAVTRYEYDSDGRRTATIVGYGTSLAQHTTYGYDQIGRVITTTIGVGSALERSDITQYNADDTIARTIQNYEDGIFTPDQPDEDIVTTYGYDQVGRTVAVTDTLGHVNVTHYDSQGRMDWTARNVVPAQFDAAGSPIYQDYDPAQPDANVATLYGLDGLGRTVFITETGILTGTFDPVTLEFSEATERVTHTEYDALSRPITVTLNYQPGVPAGPDVNLQTFMAYDTVGNLTWQRDALGRWTKIDYDALNRPITVTVNYENGDPLTVDPANQGWTDGSDTDMISVSRYDAAGHLEQRIENYVNGIFTVTEPITDQIMLYEYDPIGRVITSTVNYAPGENDPALNRATIMAFDTTTGRVIGQRDSLGRWNSQQYDLLGRATTTTLNCTGGLAPQSCGSPTADENVSTTTHYDVLDRAFETVDALGYTTHTGYDGIGRPTATIRNYVVGGPTTAITNVTTLKSYNGLGYITAATDELGYGTEIGYNGLDQTVVITDALNRVTLLGYDGSDTLRWSKRNDGQLIVYQIDGLGRVIATIVNYEDGVVGGSEPSDQDLITRTLYDAGGRRVETIDPAGRKTQFSYDQRDLLIAVTENAVDGSCTSGPCNVVTQYQFDRMGNRTTITDANNHTRYFSYDAANQRISATDALARVTSWEYDASGRMTVQHDPRGITDTLTFEYDGLSRRIQTSATNLITITAAYDALGRRSSLTDGTGTTSFAYDSLGRVTEVTAPNTGTIGYGYDAKGQRVQLTYPNSGPTLEYAYWPDGQIRIVTDTTTLASYTYDQAGRPEQVTRANGATTSYAYDGADRLLESTTTVSSTTVGAFAYDVDRLGLRLGVSETLGDAGTKLVKDIRPSSTGSSASKGVTLNGSFFFAANDGTNGTELWKSDGTAAGTVMVKDIHSGSNGSFPSNLTVMNGTLLFTAGDATNGIELWKSDGTTAGTVLVKDIQPGSTMSFATNLTVVNGTLFFRANDGTNGSELWKSDGTTSGTVLVKDIQSGSSSSTPSNLTAVNGTLFFNANDGTNGSELWKSDGTTSGTVLVKDIRSGSSSSTPSNLTMTNGALFFSANDGTNGTELWKSDGTTSGTVLVKDILSGSSSSSPSNLTAVNGTLFFSANDGTNGTELWKSDGTTSGTVLVKDIVTGSSASFPANMAAMNGTLFFVAFDDTNGQELWKSDGTTVGTELVKDISPGLVSSLPATLTAVSNRLFFTANDGTHGYELWVSDGTTNGTTLVQDTLSGSGTSNTINLSASAGRLFFVANDGTHGQELWLYTDGTRSVSYSYDGLNRLIDAAESSGTTFGYDYDAVGNRTSVTINDQTTSLSYDAANQLVGWTYDAAGNLIGDGTTTYSYDALNRLIESGATTYAYNGDGILVYDGTTRYTQDLVAPLSQVLQTTQGVTTTDYLYGYDRLATVVGGIRTWYGVDALGSVRQTLSDNGTVLGTVSYDPWGAVESGSAPTFGFTGELQNSGEGLVYLRARWYDPSYGTFTSRDPFHGQETRPATLQPYLYAGDNPINLTDPSGMCFPPIEELRELEPLNCSNLEAAGAIWHHPNANPWEKGQALAYVTLWTAGHVCALVGGAILTVEAGTAIASASLVARLRAAASAAPAVLRWLQSFVQRNPSVWRLPPFDRGVEIEQRLGHNVPASFPTIDRWNAATGQAVSIKSIDLNAQTYQNVANLTRTVTGYIDKMANYAGQPNPWGGLRIAQAAITSRGVDLAIPATGVSATQMSTLQTLQQYAQSVGVTLNIIPVP